MSERRHSLPEPEEYALLAAWKLEEPDEAVVQRVLEQAARPRRLSLRRLSLPVAATFLLLALVYWVTYTHREGRPSVEEVLLVQKEPPVSLSWEVPEVSAVMARTYRMEQRMQGMQPFIGVYPSGLLKPVSSFHRVP